MSLQLALGTIPINLCVKTFGVGDDVVIIGDYQMFVEEFLQTTFDVITFTDLECPRDLRLSFLAAVKEMVVVLGYDGRGSRLFTSVDPLPVREYHNDRLIPLYEYQISLPDLMATAYYVLTNTNLRGENDPRMAFVNSLKNASVNARQDSRNQERIVVSTPLVFSEFDIDDIEGWLEHERQWIENEDARAR